MQVKEKGMKGTDSTYPHTSSRALGIAEPHTCHAVGLLIEEYDVSDVGDLAAFLADVLFDVENGGGIFLSVISVSGTAE